MKAENEGGAAGAIAEAPPADKPRKTDKGKAAKPEQPKQVKYQGIAILGSHPVTKMMAPFNEKDVLIYACSPDNSPFGFNAALIPRADVWFELHKPISDRTRPYGYLRWLEAQDIPVIMRDREAMQFFPKAQPYPEKELKARFGPPIFSSSVAYMIAKAIVDCEAMGINKIGLFGILQGSDTEYHRHLTGTQQMLWWAKQAGIKIGGPHPSMIPAMDDGGKLRESYIAEINALNRLLSLEPTEDW